MNYRHLYHAGNFTDVFKHAVLALLIQALCRKDKPFCYLDTHAGIGRYDLESEAAQKTGEFKTGILKLLQSQKDFPEEIADYVAVIRKINAAEKLRFYPGSPLLVKHLLRANDRMILTELHSDDFKLLKQEFRNDKQIAVHHLDGYQALKAFLPPKEKRGLVFIDPPFEQPHEFEQLVEALSAAYQRWPTGIYAIWYPLKNLAAVKNFYQDLQILQLSKVLKLEFTPYPVDSPVGLNGCGMIIINSPFQLDQQLEKLLPWLLQVLAPDKALGSQCVEWIED